MIFKIQIQVLLLLAIVQGRTLVNVYLQDAELTKLTQQQGEFEKQLQNMRNELESTTKKLQSTNLRPERIGTMEDALMKHRNFLFQSSQSLTPALNLTLCKCEAISTSQKKAILEDIGKLRANIGDMQQQLKNITPCTRTRQIQQDLTEQLFFLNTVEEVLDSKCRREALLTPTIWQTNLNAPNWILGQQTLAELIDDYYDRSIKYENITNCNISSPYWNGTMCISCPQFQPLFNLYTQKCENCLGGFMYSPAVKNCVEGAKDLGRPKCRPDQFYEEKSNKCVNLVKCGVGTILDKQTNTCRLKKCQLGFEINKNTGECEPIKCIGTFYNTVTYQCQPFRICVDSFLNRQKNTCQPYNTCTNETFLDKSTNLCVQFLACPIDKYLNRTTNACDPKLVCDPITQYYNGKSNICEEKAQCSPKQFYNAVDNTCQNFRNCEGAELYLNKEKNECEQFKKCQIGLILNRITNNCIPIKKCNPDEFFSETTYQCEKFVECPNKFLNREKNQCEDYVECNNQYLNRATNKCEDWTNCPDGTWLNRTNNVCQKIKECVDKFYNFTTNDCEEFLNCQGRYLNRRLNKCEDYLTCSGKFLNRESNTCEEYVVCQPDKEFYNSTINRCQPYAVCPQFLNRTSNTCSDFVQCQENEQVNKETNKCQPKVVECLPDEVYNKDTNKCAKKPVLYMPHDNLKMYIEGKTNMASYLNQINEVRKNNPNAYVATCPQDQPFSLITNCTGCPEGYFFLDTLTCKTCKEGQVYDGASKACRTRLLLTNLRKAKLELHTMTIEEYKRYQEHLISLNSKAFAERCPDEEPYSVDGKKCISCPESEPIFDIVRQQCVSCRQGRTYDAVNMKCT